MSDPQQILNTAEGALLLRMSKAKLRELANEGQVPAFRVGTRLRYRRSDLLEWVETQALANVAPDLRLAKALKDGIAVGQPWPKSWSDEKIQDTIRLERLFFKQYGHEPATDLIGWAKFLTANRDG